MPALLAAALIGVVAGLRTFVPLAGLAWAANLGLVDLQGSWIAPLASPWAAYALTALAALELVGDKLPRTPARTHPAGLGFRIVSGAVCGAAIGLSADNWAVGLVLGAVGALSGTFLGYLFRATLAKAVARDWPIAVIEDLLAIAGAVLVVTTL